MKRHEAFCKEVWLANIHVKDGASLPHLLFFLNVTNLEVCPLLILINYRFQFTHLACELYSLLLLKFKLLRQEIKLKLQLTTSGCNLWQRCVDYGASLRYIRKSAASILRLLFIKVFNLINFLDWVLVQIIYLRLHRFVLRFVYKPKALLKVFVTHGVSFLCGLVFSLLGDIGLDRYFRFSSGRVNSWVQWFLSKALLCRWFWHDTTFVSTVERRLRHDLTGR